MQTTHTFTGAVPPLDHAAALQLLDAGVMTKPEARPIVLARIEQCRDAFERAPNDAMRNCTGRDLMIAVLRALGAELIDVGTAREWLGLGEVAGG